MLKNTFLSETTKVNTLLSTQPFDDHIFTNGSATYGEASEIITHLDSKLLLTDIKKSAGIGVDDVRDIERWLNNTLWPFIVQLVVDKKASSLLRQNERDEDAIKLANVILYKAFKLQGQIIFSASSMIDDDTKSAATQQTLLFKILSELASQRKKSNFSTLNNIKPTKLDLTNLYGYVLYAANDDFISANKFAADYIAQNRDLMTRHEWHAQACAITLFLGVLSIPAVFAMNSVLATTMLIVTPLVLLASSISLEHFYEYSTPSRAVHNYQQRFFRETEQYNTARIEYLKMINDDYVRWEDRDYFSTYMHSGV